MDTTVTSPNSTWFAAAARDLSRVCKAHGLVAPSFRCPPRQPGLNRSLIRRASGPPIVAVRLRGRTQVDVAADLLAGVLAVNPDASTDAVSALRAVLNLPVPTQTAA